MISMILLVVSIVSVLVSLLLGLLKGLKLRALIVVLYSVFLSNLIVYLSHFLYYTEVVYTNILFYSFVGMLFVITPLFVKLRLINKKIVNVIVQSVFIVTVMTFVVYNSMVLIVLDVNEILLSEYILKLILYMVISIVIIVAIFLVLSKASKYKTQTVYVVIILSLLYVGVYQYHNFGYHSIMDLEEPTFEVEEMYTFSKTENHTFPSNAVIYKKYDNKIYYYSTSSSGKLTYTFSELDLETEEVVETSFHIVMDDRYRGVKVIFHEGYTYYCNDNLIYVVHDGEYSILFRDNKDKYVQFGYNTVSQIIDDKLYFDIGWERYLVDKDTLTFVERFDMDPYGFSHDEYSYVGSIDHKIFAYSNEERFYYDGVTYDFEFERYDLTIRDGYLCDGVTCIIDGELQHYPVHFDYQGEQFAFSNYSSAFHPIYDDSDVVRMMDDISLKEDNVGLDGILFTRGYDEDYYIGKLDEETTPVLITNLNRYYDERGNYIFISLVLIVIAAAPVFTYTKKEEI